MSPGLLHGDAPQPVDYLRAVEAREQLQRAYATWRAQGRPACGEAFIRLQWAAGAHMRAALQAQVSSQRRCATS
jgi:hypothetical protein